MILRRCIEMIRAARKHEIGHARRASALVVFRRASVQDKGDNTMRD